MAEQDRLRELLAQVVPANRFYAAKFAGIDLKTTSFASLPFTTKAELVADQRDHPPYGSNRTFADDKYIRLHQTSGTSSGRPLRWLDTAESWEWLLGCWFAIFERVGILPGDRFFFPFSFGPFLGFWTAFEAASRFGNLVLPGGGLSSTARLRFLVEHQATIVCCTPTYALHLSEIAAKENIDLRQSSVRMLILAGEPGANIASTRSRIESVWGARVIDHYGMTEVGPVAVETAQEPHCMQVLHDRFHCELIQPDGDRPADDGALAELVITNLGRIGSPLIRYRTGDIVKGRRGGDGSLTLDGGVLARTDDMIHVRGNNLYPTAIEAVVRRFPEVAEFQLILDRSGSLTDLEVQIEPVDASISASLAEAVARGLRDELLFRVPVSVVAPGALPRYEMKARRLVVRTAT